MRSLPAALFLALLTVAPASAQPRGMPGPPPPVGPSRGWFFDLFAPRPPPSYGLPPPPGAARPPGSAPRAVPGAPGQPGAPGEAPRVAAPPGAVPPYEADLLRLAEIIGALHYLRPLCGASEGQRWRVEMQALIEAEAQSDDRKDRLTKSFNRGYFAFERSYRSCTPAATLAVERYLEEGAKLARDIVARYGN